MISGTFSEVALVPELAGEPVLKVVHKVYTPNAQSMAMKPFFNIALNEKGLSEHVL